MKRKASVPAAAQEEVGIKSPSITNQGPPVQISTIDSPLILSCPIKKHRPHIPPQVHPFLYTRHLIGEVKSDEAGRQAAGQVGSG